MTLTDVELSPAPPPHAASAAINIKAPVRTESFIKREFVDIELMNSAIKKGRFKPAFVHKVRRYLMSTP